MTRYFMRDTPLCQIEQQMMTPPYFKPRGHGRYYPGFKYSRDDFGEPYVVPERANRAVAYANRVDLERNLPQLSEPEEMDESRGYAVSSRGGIAHAPAQERAVKRGKQMKTFGEEER